MTVTTALMSSMPMMKLAPSKKEHLGPHAAKTTNAILDFVSTHQPDGSVPDYATLQLPAPMGRDVYRSRVNPTLCMPGFTSSPAFVCLVILISRV